MCVVHGYSKGTGGAVARPVRHSESIRRDTYWERRPGRQARRLDRRLTRAIVCADRRAVAHNGAAQVRRIAYHDVRRAGDRWSLCVVHGDREGTSGGVARAVRHFEGVRRCADRERRPGRQARRLEGGLTGTIVRTNRCSVAHNGAAQVRRIGHRDVGRASDRWQLRVRYRYREGTSGGVARPVRHLEGVCCCADWERRPGRQARRLGRALTGTVVRADRCAVAHDRTAKVRRIDYRDVRRASDRWQLRVAYGDREGAGGGVASAVRHLEGVCCCADRERRPRRQTRRLGRALTGTVVRADRGAVAHDRTAKVRRIGHRDVGRASDRWQLRVRYRYREGTSGGVARPVRHLEGVCRCADWERRPGRQARRLGRALTGTVVRADRCGVAHDGAT